MTIEIVDLPSYKMVMFHSFLYAYQRVNPLEICFPGVEQPLSRKARLAQAVTRLAACPAGAWAEALSVLEAGADGDGNADSLNYS